MKKKYTIVILISLSLGFILGIVWKRYLYPLFPYSKVVSLFSAHNPIPETGKWNFISDKDDSSVMSAKQKEAIKQLQSIGYANGSMPAPQEDKVTFYTEKSAYNGLNLLVSGHAPEAILMDMEGNELHRWTCDIYRAWPDFNPEKPLPPHGCWRRAHLMENGDLYAIFEGIGILKLDKDSKLIWSLRNGAHHDLYITKEGLIFVLTRKAYINPEYNKNEPILEDYITILEPSGEKIKEISILNLIKKSTISPIIFRAPESGDILHTNTIEVIEEERGISKYPWKPGSVIMSVLKLDLVFVVDLETEAILWAESDYWRRQHQPTLLNNGNLLIFDNRTSVNKSTVLEMDPLHRTIIWKYSGNEKMPFYTHTCGSCQRLPNGNTLITESDQGRAFEVNENKDIVWEYINPYRAGKNNEFIATLFEVIRIDDIDTEDWE